MVLIQIVFILFFSFALIKTLKKFFKKEIKLATTFVWLIFWTLGILIVLWPDSTFYLSRRLGISRGADLVVYISLVLLFFLVFKIIIEQEKQKREITKITRELALKEESYEKR